MQYDNHGRRAIWSAFLLLLVGAGLAFWASETESAWQFLIGALSVLSLALAGGCIGILVVNQEAKSQAESEVQRERELDHAR